MKYESHIVIPYFQVTQLSATVLIEYLDSPYEALIPWNKYLPNPSTTHTEWLAEIERLKTLTTNEHNTPPK